MQITLAQGFNLYKTKFLRHNGGSQ